MNTSTVSHAASSSADYHLQAKSLLIVDDEELIRMSLKSELGNAGYQVTTAACGEEALEVLQKQQFDLIITDLVMDAIDGIQVLKTAKDILPAVPVIILTGFGDVTSAIDALRLGADDYVCKPCDSRELTIRIKRCLEKQDLSRQLATKNRALEKEIEKQRKTEAKLTKLASQLTIANTELKEFNHVVSHDLQEPLTLIMAFAARLRKKHAASLSKQAREYVDQIQSAATRMHRLVDSLLIYSRISSKAATSFSEVELAYTILNVLADLQVRIEKTGAHMEVKDLPTIYGDPSQMHQLLQNLIANSLKYRHRDKTPHIKVYSLPGVVYEGGIPSYRIVVQDNGIGFDRKGAEKIFNIFERLHSDTEMKGAGVGLAICKKIVERHGGTITAEGTPGRGATFTITLPKTGR